MPKPTPAPEPEAKAFDPFGPVIAKIESDVVLPIERFVGKAVGATEAEVSKLKAWFDGLSGAEQKGYVDSLNGKSARDLRTDLDARLAPDAAESPQEGTKAEDGAPAAGGIPGPPAVDYSIPTPEA